MSDAVKKWLIGAGLTALVSLGMLYMHYQIRSQVEEQLADAGYPSSAMVALMQKDIEANEERIALNKENADKLDSKIERVVQILLEE